jgi:uncharacterized protein YndB with AHSA1/START domain
MGPDRAGQKITDRIEKKVFLRAPLARVWDAIGDAREFGRWFGVVFDGPFAPGKQVAARVVATEADPDFAKMQEPYVGMSFDVFVERIEPLRHLSFRWHPGEMEPGVDRSKEPTTLVVFELEEVPGGTMLTVTESGFDRIPLERRARAFTENEQGWEIQSKRIAKYLESARR